MTATTHRTPGSRSAIVGDNPGDWMIHCDILEHQDSGMMSYFRVV